MKLRLTLTAVVIGLGFLFQTAWNAVVSPATGAATAAQLDDTLQSWIIANAIRSNFVEYATVAVCAALILVIWFVRVGKPNHE